MNCGFALINVYVYVDDLIVNLTMFLLQIMERRRLVTVAILLFLFAVSTGRGNTTNMRSKVLYLYHSFIWFRSLGL